MENLRKFAKSRLGQFSLLLVVAPMAFLGLSNTMSAGANPDEIVSIGDKSITLNELQTAVNNQKAALIKDGVDSSLIRDKVLQQRILENLINRSLIESQAEKLGFSVSDASITAMLKALPELQDANGNFSNDKFAQIMTHKHMTKDQLFAQQRGKMTVDWLSNNIVNTSIYPMSQVNKMIDMQLQSRNVWLYRIPWQNYANQVTVTEQDIEKYYDQHRESLKTIPMVDLSYIQLSPKDILVLPKDITQAELEQQYQAYKQENNLTDNREISQILLTGNDAKQKAKATKARLDQGENFEKLAKEVSEDETAKDTGGAIGTFDPAMFGDSANLVSDALKNLKVGEVSDPVKTSFGYQIFTITQANGDGVPTLEELEDELVSKAIEYKQQSEFMDTVTKINTAVADGFSLQDIANQEEVVIKTIANYQQQENLSDLSQPSVIEAAFDEYTLHSQSVSPIIEVENSMVWVQPTNYRPTEIMGLEVAKQKIKATLTQEKATQLSLADAEKVASSINVKEDIELKDIEFIELTDLRRDNNQLYAVENSMAFSQKVEKNGIVTMSVATEKGASVMVADVLKLSPTLQISEAERQKIANGIRKKIGDNQMRDYLDYLNTVAQVEINEEKLKQANGVGQ